MVIGACATTSTVKSVLGTYERIEDGDTERVVLLDNGIFEVYENGKKRSEAKWKLTKEGVLHLTISDEGIFVCRINKDGSITMIARIDKDDGKREEAPKEEQMTFKKIK